MLCWLHPAKLHYFNSLPRVIKNKFYLGMFWHSLTLSIFSRSLHPHLFAFFLLAHVVPKMGHFSHSSIPLFGLTRGQFWRGDSDERDQFHDKHKQKNLNTMIILKRNLLVIVDVRVLDETSLWCSNRKYIDKNIYLSCNNTITVWHHFPFAISNYIRPWSKVILEGVKKWMFSRSYILIVKALFSGNFGLI